MAKTKLFRCGLMAQASAAGLLASIATSHPCSAAEDPLLTRVTDCMWAVAGKASSERLDPAIFERRVVMACQREKRAFIASEIKRDPTIGAVVAENVLGIFEQEIARRYSARRSNQ